MRAVVHDRYGPPDVLRSTTSSSPCPRTTRCWSGFTPPPSPGRMGLRSAEPLIARFFTGLRRPRRRVLGMEFAGEVEEVGPAVTEFAVGDEVFGSGVRRHAEFVCMRESARHRAQAGRA